jgi:hypothetical protein
VQLEVALLLLLSRTILLAAIFLAPLIALGREECVLAQQSKATRQVVFPSYSLGRLYDLRPGVDWVKFKNIYGQFLGTAANRLTVPQSARLALELDATLAEQPKLLDSLAPDALFAVRARNFEQADGLLNSISRLKGLRRVELVDCSFSETSLSGLSRLTELERLTASGCGLKGDCLKDLVRLKKLKYLNISSNMLRPNSCTYIAQMTKMVHLDLARAQLTDSDLATLSKLANIETLNINSNPALTTKGFSTIRAFKKLDSLLVQNTAIKVSDLLALHGLPLHSIYIPELKIRNAEMQQLHRAFPNCKISLQSHAADSDSRVIFGPVSR